MKKRVFIRTFGCQMNKYDSEVLAGELERAGYALTSEPRDADVILFNTCSVRQHAENRVYSHIGALKKRKERNPNLVIGILGCIAQDRKESLLAQFPQLDLVAGTMELVHVPGYLNAIIEEKERIARTNEYGELLYERNPHHRTNASQAYITIMRGCDNFCSYCIVPYVRGREISRPMGEILDEARALCGDGVKEITLLGQNVNSYGKRFAQESADSADSNVTLTTLLEKLNELDGLERLRFVTNHPKDLSDELIYAIRDLPTVCEYLHMPAQSGSDKILRQMNRGYTRRQYLELVEKIRENIPDAAVAGDFIVGFPGETEDDFNDTLDLVRRVRYKSAFVFSYSPRPKTKACKLNDDVPQEVKNRRHQKLLALVQRIALEENLKFRGQQVEILVEGNSKKDATKLTGRSRHDRIVVFKGPEELTGKLASVTITDASAVTLYGEHYSDELSKMQRPFNR